MNCFQINSNSSLVNSLIEMVYFLFACNEIGHSIVDSSFCSAVSSIDCRRTSQTHFSERVLKRPARARVSLRRLARLRQLQHLDPAAFSLQFRAERLGRHRQETAATRWPTFSRPCTPCLLDLDLRDAELLARDTVRKHPLELCVVRADLALSLLRCALRVPAAAS